MTCGKMFINHPKVLNWAFVGSRISCDPAPTNTDNDVLVLYKSSFFNKNPYIKELLEDGFVEDTGTGGYGWLYFKEGRPLFVATSEFISMHKGELNLILTTDEKFYGRFMMATHIATKLNLLDKRDRIMLFQGILYGNYENLGHGPNWWKNET